MSRALVLPLLTLVLSLGNVSLSAAQTRDWPFPSRSPAASALLARPTPTSTPPPFDFPLRQETWEQLSNREISREGQAALALRPQQWYHGETDNFVFHYRNLSDALQVAREIEFDLWYVAQSLGASNSAYTRKSHIFVFADEQEWQVFLAETNEPKWTHSFAFHDELFLNVHGRGHGFDSQTLAHEATHAVVSRIYVSRRWPLWLNEGFAEYMDEASAAARHWQAPSQNQHNLAHAKMTVAELFATARYPVGGEAVARLYDTSSKFVRYLYKKYPEELFPKFVDRLLNGEDVVTALHETYGSEFHDMNEFEKNFSRFTR